MNDHESYQGYRLCLFRRRVIRCGIGLVSVLALQGFVPGGGPEGEPAPGRAAPEGQSMEQAFMDPPQSARPRTWWHWTGGNVTLEGIEKDLEWMSRVGIAGFQLADVSYGLGQEVERKLYFGSPEWLDAVRYAAEKADSLGLEMAIFSSAGWSLAGGPWVKPRQAMKKLVWSTTVVEGPVLFSAELPAPPTTNGPIGNIAPGRRGQSPDPEFYSDERILAFPEPSDEEDFAGSGPVFSSGSGRIRDPGALTDNDLNSRLTLRRMPGDDRIRLRLDFDRPFTARALSIASPGGIPAGRLLAENAAGEYETLLILPGIQNYRGSRVCTFSFPETCSRRYLVEFTGLARRPADFIVQPEPAVPDLIYLTSLVLHSAGRVNRWEDKAGFSLLNEYTSSATPAADPGSVIPSGKVIDLSGQVDEKGRLNWKVPEGKWIILRLGYSLTGAKNRPAVPSGLGYEVDKLNEDYVRSYMEGYTAPLKNALGPLYGRSLQYVMLDSWEAGMQNWTDDMTAEFTKRRGYDPGPYLPALAGYVVESAETSDRFLWDFRRTLADMFAENFYGTVTAYLNKEGLHTYGEASGVSLEILEDALLCKKFVDIPMGEFWVHDLHPGPLYYVDVRGAASAGHAYGKPVVAAESFTGGGYESPAALKRISDYWFTRGVNRLVFHTSAHQPMDTKPGNTMVGTHINRNITWAEQAGPFMDYLSRNSYMLRQGVFVADLAYLLDEGAPSTMPFWGAGLVPVPPEGYDYDYVNTDILLNRMSVDPSGRIVLPGGMSYAVLVLPSTGQMTLKVLDKIHQLVHDGATVIGPGVTASPSLADYLHGGDKFGELAADLWADLDGITRTRDYYGKGMVVWGESPESVLALKGIPPDVETVPGYGQKLYGVKPASGSGQSPGLGAGPGPGAALSWIHRRTPGAEIYFLANRSPEASEYRVRFRSGPSDVEFWDPSNGSIRPAPYSFGDGFTDVPVRMDAYGSVFVVFLNTAPGPGRELPARKEIQLEELGGPWKVDFHDGPGSPGVVTLKELASWTANAEEKVKYFSGSATYSRTVEVPPGWREPGQELYLDLGEVGDLAEVFLNGKKLATLWKEPYRVSLSGALQNGSNLLEVTVTNEWTNRILGDMNAGKGEKVLNTRVRIFAGGGLPRSGLMGPVRIVAVRVE